MLQENFPFIQKKYPIFVSIGFGLVIAFLFLPIVLFSFTRIVKAGETRYAELEVSKVETLLLQDISQLSRSLGDWSAWDDVYQYAQNQNQDFIKSNLADDTFTTLDINAILIVDAKNHLIYQKTVEDQDYGSTATLYDFRELLTTYPQLSSLESMDPQKGILIYQNQIMIVVSNPILTSANEGPPAGRLVFIRFLNANQIELLSELSYRKVDLFSNERFLDETHQEPSFSLQQDGVTIKNVNLSTAVGYLRLQDLVGKDTIILKVEIPRYLNQQARLTLQIMLVTLAAMTVILAMVAYFYTRAIQTARQQKLEQETAARMLEKSKQNAIELEKKVRDRTKELELKNKDLETFNYSVSHDLKSPLRGISGYATLLLSEYHEKFDPKGQAYLQTLVTATNRMNRLIEDLLSYANTDRSDIQLTNIYLNRLVDWILVDFQETIQQHHIVIEKQISINELLCDEKALSLILRNLLDNAFKFSQSAKKPKIIVTCKSEEGKWLIAVADNGIGFDMQFHHKIFDVFERLHLPEEYPGTGIGLALVKKTVEKMGGNVYARSVLGSGSTFFVEIPITDGSQDLQSAGQIPLFSE